MGEIEKCDFMNGLDKVVMSKQRRKYPGQIKKTFIEWKGFYNYIF